MSQLVTVFGGSGLIGRHTVRALVRAGHRVRVAVRVPNHANYLLPAGQVGQIQIVKCNVTNGAQVASALRGAHAAINLVGVLYSRGSQSFQALHADAAATIAEAAREAGVGALVHVSALGANAESESAYFRSKAEGEARIREAFPAATIFRPSIVFGPEDGFFNKFAELARLSPVLPLIGGGHTKFQPVFVGDVARAALKCIGDEFARGKIFELGGPGVYSFKGLMEFLLRTIDRKRFLLPVPYAVASLDAFVLQFLPTPLLTPDQVRMLKTDTVVSPDALKLSDLGIAPDSIEAVVPSYLWRFRPRGQYEQTGVSAAP